MDHKLIKTEIRDAIREKNPEKVRLLLNEIDINSYIDENGYAPIHLIADYDLNDENSREIFNLITTQPGIDINLGRGARLDDTQLRFYRQAAVHGLFRSTKFTGLTTLQRSHRAGGDIEGDTILHMARTSSLVKMLLKIDKVDVNNQGHLESMSPLLENFFKLGHQGGIVQDLEILEICKLLIENGADVNLHDRRGMAPVHLLFKLNFNYSQMVDFYNFFTNRPELDVNVESSTGLTLLDNTSNVEQMRIFIDLPWKPMFLLSGLQFNDEIINEKIHQKWNQIDYAELMASLLHGFKNKTYLANKYVMKVVWKYMYENKEKTRGEDFEAFFNNMPPYSNYNLMTLEENGYFIDLYEHFVQLYFKYTKINQIFEYKLVRGIFMQFGDCRALRTTIKHMNSNQFFKFNLDADLFLYIITHFECDLDKILQSLKPNYDNDNDPLTYLFHLQHVSRYCTLPPYLYEYFKTNGQDYEEFDEGIREIESVISKPKSLLELSRNIARRFLACKYGATGPKDMDLILNQIEIPRLVKQILMLEKTIHPHIPLPGSIWNEELQNQYGP